MCFSNSFTVKENFVLVIKLLFFFLIVSQMQKLCLFKEAGRNFLVALYYKMGDLEFLSLTNFPQRCALPHNLFDNDVNISNLLQTV